MLRHVQGDFFLAVLSLVVLSLAVLSLVLLYLASLLTRGRVIFSVFEGIVKLVFLSFSFSRLLPCVV